MIEEIVIRILTGLWEVIVFVSPVLAPIVLGTLAIALWKHYKQRQFIAGMEWALLEINIPRDIQKTPLAMELIFTNALHQVSRKTWVARVLKGQVRLWYSLEIVSIGGEVHFFIWTPTRTKNLVEAQVYAQFPQASIVEVEDYTHAVPYSFKQSSWKLFGTEFRKRTDEVLPIKTYPAYGLDKTAEEEEKVDPLTPILELLGTTTQKEQIWIQILVRGVGPMHKRWGGFFKKWNWKEEIDRKINELVEPFTQVSDETQKKSGQPQGHILDIVKALQESSDKVAFDCGIRCLYLAPEEHFNMNTARAMRMIFRQFSSYNFNSLEMGNVMPFTNDTYLDMYRRREFFYPRLAYTFDSPIQIKKSFGAPKPFLMNTEELATIFHFPGRVAETPTLRRVESKTAEPPSNLPL